jgi:hypothetical protein
MRIEQSFIRNLLRYLLPVFFFFLLANFSLVRGSYGQEAVITDFTVTNSETDLLLYMTVKDWMTAEMEAAIQNGIPITFAFYIDLFANRSKWPDKKIREFEFNHIMEYDSLKKEYTILRHENGDSKVTASFEEAKKIISEINGFKVLELNELDPQTSYTLRAKAKMARKTMPLYFHYLIPFSSPWAFETKWHKLNLQFTQ